MNTESWAEMAKNSLHYLDSSDEIKEPQDAFCNCFVKFQIFLTKIFYKLGYTIALRPVYFIIVPIFIAIIGITGVQQIVYEKNPEHLFNPSNGEGQRDQIIIEELFPMNTSENFDLYRVTRISPSCILAVSSKDEETILRTKVFEEIFALDQAIKNLSIKWDENTYNFPEICAKIHGECPDNKVLDLKEFMPEIENGSLLINYPVMAYPLSLPSFFGGLDVNETEGILMSAKAVPLVYSFKYDDKKQKERGILFEKKILSYLEKAEFKYIKVAQITSRSVEDELERNVKHISPFVLLLFGLVVVFSSANLFSFDWVRSKLLLGVVGILSVCLGTGAAFGFLMYFRVPFIGISMAAPFLMLGIGIDDMFVVLSAWHRTRIQEEVPIRMAKSYREAAVSITITSLTNILSFFTGTISPFPAVSIFCLYTGFACLFNYIWFITFFGGCLALAGYQERNGKHIFSRKKINAKSTVVEDSRCCYRIWCTGGIDPNDPWNPKDNRPNLIMVFFRDYLGKALNIPAIKGLVICLFAVYFSGAIYGCTQIKEGLELTKLGLDDSYIKDYFNAQSNWFRRYPYRIQVIINENLTYSNPDTKRAVLELHDTFERLDCIAGRIFTQSWMRGFYRFLDRNKTINDMITDEKSFIKVLKTKFLDGRQNADFIDMKFNEDESQIVASRFVLQAYDIKDSVEDVNLVLLLRKVAKESPFRVIVFNMLFPTFDQFLLVKYACIQAIGLASLIMIVTALVFISNPLCSLWIAFSIVSIEIGVVGYMSLWGVNLDSISMVNLIMCVGFSVDFSAHIAYAFLTAKDATPSGKVKECLYSMGLPILQGGLSTIVGVLALALAPSYVFNVFYKTIFLVIVFGLMHSLFILPVMLSILGPGTFTKQIEDPSSSPQFPKLSIQDDAINLDMDETQNAKNTILSSHEDGLAKDLGLGSSGPSSQSSSTLGEIDSFSTNELHKEMEFYTHERGTSNEAYSHDTEDDVGERL